MTKTRVEYANEQITVYPGPCTLKCKYCLYNQPIWTYRIRHANPLKEATRLLRAKKKQTIVVSFTTDPYQPRELTEHLTRKTLEILASSKFFRDRHWHVAGDSVSCFMTHRVMVLSKSVLMEDDFPFFKLWYQRGFDIWVGTTLTSVIPIPDEPCQWTNTHRMVMLQRAHNLGLPTWASIEPWIPDKTFPRQIIEATHEYVDWYVIGRLNYVKRFGYPEISKGYYREELKWIQALFDEFGFSPSSKPCQKGYHLKRELTENP